MNISEITHPEYDSNVSDWRKWESVFTGGSSFIDDYLVKFSVREDEADFEDRKTITYAPSHAKAAVLDVKNSIFQRTVDIKRKSPDISYMEAVSGLSGGVDYTGNTMNGYIGRVILPTLLSIGKVGIFIDKPIIEKTDTLLDTKNIRPYIYKYDATSIRSWTEDTLGNIVALLLQDKSVKVDEDTGLTSEEVESYRLLQLTDDGVQVTFFNDANEVVGNETLALSRIPFVVCELSSSLLTDIADYQIAMLNLASSDMNYALKSNFPFYTEQYNQQAEMVNRAKQKTDGSKGETAKTKIGSATGRRYPKDLERPGFINPSPEPLRVSMEKQEVLKQEIYQLVTLAVTNLKPTRASAESKSFDERSLEAGLSYIGLELEYAEQQVAEIWAEYNGVPTEEISVKYPDKYSLKTGEQQRAEAKELKELLTSVPSATYRKEIVKQIARLTTDHRVSEQELEEIYNEIDAAQVVVTDPDIIINDHEAGLVSTKTASLLRGYAAGESEQAAKDHAERAARVALAQSEAGARGVSDLASGPQDAKDEKAQLRLEGKDT